MSFFTKALLMIVMVESFYVSLYGMANIIFSNPNCRDIIRFIGFYVSNTEKPFLYPYPNETTKHTVSAFNDFEDYIKIRSNKDFAFLILTCKSTYNALQYNFFISVPTLHAFIKQYDPVLNYCNVKEWSFLHGTNAKDKVVSLDMECTKDYSSIYYHSYIGFDDHNAYLILSYLDSNRMLSVLYSNPDQLEKISEKITIKDFQHFLSCNGEEKFEKPSIYKILQFISSYGHEIVLKKQKNDKKFLLQVKMNDDKGESVPYSFISLFLKKIMSSWNVEWNSFSE